ncbi:aminotransferase class V-fold PLP-dependent enzyme [Candidatus Uhrbacteria bacterium]|nr:aminotransferase class V-fold PLP-dependent enzyme [Candidatus Uhrbacteria bacterium]
MKERYFDHASTTYLDQRVLQTMLPFFSENFGNPSSFHAVGLKAKVAVTEARKKIAAILNSREEEIIFTSGGTESDNLALIGTIRAHSGRGKHVITSSIEHHAVLEPLLLLQKRGEIELTILPVDREGLVSVKDIETALRPDTILISIMFANNEIGTIQPIADIGRSLLNWKKQQATNFPYFHTDACQAAGVLDLDVEKLHVDLMTINGSKIYGPKGIGLLYIRRGTRIEPMMIGGGQERNLRSGTENTPGIIGLSTALALAQQEREQENARLIELRQRLIEGLLKIPKTRLNGHPTERLPNNVNISFLDIEGEAAVLYLDAEGIYVSTGSACASASLDPSHVILATGLSYEAAHGSLRFTLGKHTTDEDIDALISVMPNVVQKLRHMSPVNLDMKYFVK